MFQTTVWAILKLAWTNMKPRRILSPSSLLPSTIQTGSPESARRHHTEISILSYSLNWNLRWGPLWHLGIIYTHACISAPKKATVNILIFRSIQTTLSSNRSKLELILMILNCSKPCNFQHKIKWALDQILFQESIGDFSQLRLFIFFRFPE